MLVSVHFASSSLFLLHGDADEAEKKAPPPRSSNVLSDDRGLPGLRRHEVGPSGGRKFV
jgi:hypothetical protein